MALEPFEDKWTAFGWSVKRIDGHNHFEILQALESSRSSVKPTVIIADTIKGKGVSFMENQILWHYRSAQGEEFESAMKELKGLS